MLTMLQFHCLAIDYPAAHYHALLLLSQNRSLMVTSIKYGVWQQPCKTCDMIGMQIKSWEDIRQDKTTQTYIKHCSWHELHEFKANQLNGKMRSLSNKSVWSGFCRVHALIFPQENI